MDVAATKFKSIYGWNDHFASQVPDGLKDLAPARVICEERGLYSVQVNIDVIKSASVSGKMQFEATGRVDYPAVGDWVLVELPPQSDRLLIRLVLPRQTVLQRKQAGETAETQILATNVDYAFVTTSVNDDFNLRRIERYLAIIREAGSSPVILLTKSDTRSSEIAGIVKSVSAEFPGVPVHALSKDSYDDADFLPNYLTEGTTSVFLGSSGVGKSTLVNFLIGDSLIKTQEVRDSDGKGRHTTTSRNLYLSRYGGLVIDTPGMRELQLSDHGEGVSTQFADVEALIQSCKFTDCQHQSEPGCAIKRAIAGRVLSEERWRSYQKLEAEVRHGLRKQNKVMAAEDRKAWKKLTSDARERGLSKRKG